MFVWVVVVMVREAPPSFAREKLGAALRFGLPLVPHLVFGWILAVADRLFLERMVSLDEVGLYSLGYQIAMIISLLVNAINSAWSPIFYDTAKSHANAPAMVARVCTLYTAGVSLAAAGLILAAPDLLHLMATPAYFGAAPVVPVVAVAYVFQGLYFMSVTALFYVKRTRILPALTGIAAVVNVSANLLLIPRLGMMGAAWATVLSFGALFIGTNIAAQRVYHIPYEYRKMVGLLVMLGLVAVGSSFTNEWPRPSGLGARLLLLIMYVVVVLQLGIVRLDELKRLTKLRR